MSSRASVSRGIGRPIRGRANNGAVLGTGRTRNYSGEQITSQNIHHSPKTPPSNASGSFVSNAMDEPFTQPNVTQESVPRTQPRDHIVLGDLKVNDKVKKSLETIATKLFTGWPPNYGNLEPKAREAYINQFSARYRECMEEKYGPDRAQHPTFDYEIWIGITGPPKKGRLVGVPEQLSHPHLFHPSKPQEDRCVVLERQFVELKTQMEMMQVGMTELKAINQKLMEENLEQRAHFKSSMSNIWGVLINMGVVNPNTIPFNVVTGGGYSSQQHPSYMFGQPSQPQQPLPF
ncbi:unnamed protein product [Cuscuta europaea]|uniref:Uncharacterized protein n=1 Tax=Cuscuta europaea TaxID=41803 RepID=A0A9P0ZZY3_CUSEU|nr:unnamed protein product [Cuscuta europaea]